MTKFRWRRGDRKGQWYQTRRETWIAAHHALHGLPGAERGRMTPIEGVEIEEGA